MWTSSTALLQEGTELALLCAAHFDGAPKPVLDNFLPPFFDRYKVDPVSHIQVFRHFTRTYLCLLFRIRHKQSQFWHPPTDDTPSISLPSPALSV